MKKITILALVLVLCLGAIGVGYAKWTDEININGTVETGTVDLEVGSIWSGVYVYKNLDTHELVVYQPNPATAAQIADNNLLLVASSWAQAGVEDDTIDVFLDNIFPTCFPWKADAFLHYAGTIPGKISAIEITTPDPDDAWLLDYIVVVMKISPPLPNSLPTNTPVIVGTQLHNCDDISLVVRFDPLPQDNDLQGLTAQFTIKIEVEQWAECMTPP